MVSENHPAVESHAVLALAAGDDAADERADLRVGVKKHPPVHGAVAQEVEGTGLPMANGAGHGRWQKQGSCQRRMGVVGRFGGVKSREAIRETRLRHPRDGHCGN